MNSMYIYISSKGAGRLEGGGSASDKEAGKLRGRGRGSATRA